MKPKPHFSHSQIELAAKIFNDIAEGIDCGESRFTLLQAVGYWASVACEQSRERAALESRLAIFQSAMKLANAAVKGKT